MANIVSISGKVIEKPQFSHVTHGEEIYSLKLGSIRKSGVLDVIKCHVPETLVTEVAENEYITVFGEIRTWNFSDEAGKCHLDVYVFVEEVGSFAGDINTVDFSGFICKEPQYRETPLGREIADLLVACNRERSGKSDYIPCICWGRNARRASGFEVADKVRITGRLQSREYTKKCDDGTLDIRTAYEVSVSTICKEETCESEN